MNVGHVPFLLALQDGVDPDALFKIMLQKEVQACAEDLRVTGEEAVQGLQSVKKQVDHVSKSVFSLELLTPLQQQLEECRQKKYAFEPIPAEMQKTYVEKSAELEKRNKSVQALNANLAGLLEYAATTPPPSEVERAIIEYGQQAAEKIGRK